MTDVRLAINKPISEFLPGQHNRIKKSKVKLFVVCVNKQHNKVFSSEPGKINMIGNILV